MTKLERLEAKVAAWNTAHPLGTLVKAYLLTIGDDLHARTRRVRAPAEVLGGHTPVAWIEGVSGCVALTHVVDVARGEGTQA